MAPSICDAFDNTHVQCINDTLYINRTVFKPQFKHFTKYAKYAFLLLSSIHVSESNRVFSLVTTREISKLFYNYPVFFEV